jgi:flagellar biosynthesis/type III secretory pathway protein FliH
MSYKNVHGLKDVIQSGSNNHMVRPLHAYQKEEIQNLYEYTRIEKTSLHEEEKTSEEQKKYEKMMQEIEMQKLELEQEKRKILTIKSEIEKKLENAVYKIDDFNKDMLKNMVLLVSGLLEEILHKNVDMYQSYITSSVEEVMLLLRNAESIEFLVSKDMYEGVCEQVKKKGQNHVKIIQEDSFSYGEFFIKSSLGTIDASIHKRIFEMIKRFNQNHG